MTRDQLTHRFRLIAEDMHLEVEAVRAERNRPKGGQSCGPRGGPLTNAGPGVLQGVEWWARAIEEAASEVEDGLKARAAKKEEEAQAGPEAAAELEGALVDLWNQAVRRLREQGDRLRRRTLEIADRLDRAADAKAATLVAGGTAASVASIVYEMRAFARELRTLSEEASR